MKRLFLLLMFAAALAAAGRDRVAPRTLLFAERLMHYGLYQNFLQNGYIDAPLAWDRATRHSDTGFSFETYASCRVQMDQLRDYGLDGFSVFARSGDLRGVTDINAYYRKAGATDLRVLPIFDYGESVDPKQPDAKAFAKIIKWAQQAEFAPRIGKKVLLVSYNYRLFAPEVHRANVAAIRQELGNDDFLLVGDLHLAKLSKLRRQFHAKGRLEPAEVDELEKMFTDVLDVADGIQLIGKEFRRVPEGPYVSDFDFSFFDAYVGPMAEKVLSRPEYKDKILGFYVHQGYISLESGMNHTEDGTRTLRRHFDRYVRFNPDYLSFFEWNEVSEHTMFQPTVLSGKTIGRIIRHYAHVLRGEKPDLYPGDDPSVPSLALSYRYVYKPGERLDFELLAIPDGQPAKTHAVKLALVASDGTVAKTFPEVKVSTGELASTNWCAAGEALVPGEAYAPVLTVDGEPWRGFQPVRSQPSVNGNYKSARHSLRDLLRPVRAKAQLKTLKDGAYAYRVDLDAGKDLSSLVLMAGDREVDAAGIRPEYDATSNVIVRLSVTTPVPGRGTLKVRVLNASKMKAASIWAPNVNPGWARPSKDVGFTSETYWWLAETGYELQIPKAEAAAAVIEVTMEPDHHKGKYALVPATIPVKTLLEKGACGRILCPETGLRVEARRERFLPDLPAALNVPTTRWQGVVHVDGPNPVFYFRAIAKDGRLWRSEPFRPATVAAQPTARIGYWSETTKRSEWIDVPRALLPEHVFRFDPDGGVMLFDRDWPSAPATLGGAFYGGESASSRETRALIPQGGVEPTWIREDGRWILRFDGTNDYLGVTREVFPAAAFTLVLDLRPDYRGETMTLFRHASYRRASICLYLQDGELRAYWGDHDINSPTQAQSYFNTGLQLRNGAWNRVKVTYDYHKLTFEVDGRKKSYPFARRPFSYKACSVGLPGGEDTGPQGMKKIVPYKGDLREFGIYHHTENLAEPFPCLVGD